MQRYCLVIVLFCVQLLSAYPETGVFGSIGDDFSDVVLQQQQILSFIQSLSSTCCGMTPTEVCTGTPITQMDIATNTFIISSSGTYCVQEDLTIPGGFADSIMIDIQVDDVELNLNGHTLDGTSIVGFTVINAGNVNNIAIKNGIVENSAFGLDFLTVNTLVVQDITSRGHSRGIRLNTVSNCLIQGCHCTNNSVLGLDATDAYGAIIGNGPNDLSQFSNNTLTSNGIAMVDSAFLLQWCSAENNGSTGYVLLDSLGLMLFCRASGNPTRALEARTVGVGQNSRWGFMGNIGINPGDGIFSSIFAPALSTTFPVSGTTSYSFDMGGNS